MPICVLPRLTTSYWAPGERHRNYFSRPPPSSVWASEHASRAGLKVADRAPRACTTLERPAPVSPTVQEERRPSPSSCISDALCTPEILPYAQKQLIDLPGATQQRHICH